MILKVGANRCDKLIRQETMLDEVVSLRHVDDGYGRVNGVCARFTVHDNDWTLTFCCKIELTHKRRRASLDRERFVMMR